MNMKQKSKLAAVVIAAALPLCGYADSNPVTAVGDGIGDVVQGVGTGVKDVGKGINKAFDGSSNHTHTKANNNQGTTDPAITSNVKEKISQSHMNNISVSSKNGVVFLKGEVGSEDQVKQLVDMAKSVDGVKSVDSSMLTVN